MVKGLLNSRGSSAQLPLILKDWNCQKLFLVTGKNSFDNSSKCKKILADLSAIEILRHSDFKVNPKIEDIKKGAKKARDFGPDVIVAIGGGSVMDTAKLIALAMDDAIDLEGQIKAGLPPPKRNIPLVLIPTTAGSGSESTHFAVVYIDNKKYSVADASLLPDAVILDAEFTDNIPKYLTSVTAFDAFSQAVESYWSAGSTEESRSYSIESVRLIDAIFNDLVSNPSEETRDKMIYAAFLAGKAINISKTTAPHAVSYSITTKYGIPHGHAVAITLGLFFEYNLNSAKELFNTPNEYDSYMLRMKHLLASFNVETAKEAKTKIARMMSLGGLETRLEKIGMEKIEDIKYLSEGVNYERLRNNPFKVEEKDLYELLTRTF